MYCVKVEPGRERIRVRHFSNGFLPSYLPADKAGGKEGKRFVVPGYVFLLQPASGAVKVPDEEWAVIEAISDPHPSAADPAEGTIRSGPLKRIAEKIAAVEERRVLVEAELLGEKRRYWLAVRPADGEEPEEKPEAKPKPAGKPKDREEKTVKKGKAAYTEEQKAAMMARAEEIGVQAAAKEFGVQWQVIAQFRRRAAEKAAAKAAPADTPEAEEPAGEEDALRVENAVLREKVAKLEAQVAKLKKAIQELM